MKKIYIILFVLAIMMFNACRDFLKEENKSNVYADDFYKTQAGYESLINSTYSALRDIYGGNPWLFCAGTDMYGRGRDGSSIEPIAFSTYKELNPSTTGIDALYISCYKQIQLANMSINYSTLTVQNSTIPLRVAEARYLRANAYFLLVQTYGDVPLITAYFKEVNTSFTRTSKAEIYNFLIKELNEIVDILKDTKGSVVHTGRVTGRAIQHLLAKVYLTRGWDDDIKQADDFSEAARFADAAIGEQVLYNDYASLWDINNRYGTEVNKEIIFSVQYSHANIATSPSTLGNKQSNFFSSYIGGSSESGRIINKIYTLCPTKYTLDLFTEQDKRWGIAFMIEIYNRYLDYYDVKDKNTLSVTHFYAPSWFDLTAGANGDTAKYRAGVLNADKTTNTDRTTIDKYKKNRAKTIIHAYPTYALTIHPSKDFETIITKKFDDPKAVFGESSSGRDIILSRLGDTYLIAAEAYLQKGDNATAMQRLNSVRTRAGISTVTSIDINVILNERATELFGEYHRWFDLKRTKTLIDRCVKYNPDITDASNFNGNNGEKKILRPIPQSVIDLNRNFNLKQNAAYN